MTTEMSTLRAFHGDPKVKAKYLRRVEEHRRLDQLVQGTGWRDGRGCAVGCTLHAYDHSRYPVDLGLPEWLAHLEDRVFERLPADRAQAWPGAFLRAIRPGAVLDGVLHDFLAWVLVDPEHGAVNRVGDDDHVRAAIEEVAAMHLDRVPADDPRWAELGSAASSAASSVAWSAALSAANSATWNVASNAAWSAAESAALSAASSATWNVARSKFWVAASEYLLKLLEEA